MYIIVHFAAIYVQKYISVSDRRNAEYSCYLYELAYFTFDILCFHYLVLRACNVVVNNPITVCLLWVLMAVFRWFCVAH